MPTLTVMNSLVTAALLSLAGFFVLLFWGRRLGREGRAAGAVGTALALVALGLSVTALVFWVAKDGFKTPDYVEAFTYRWINVPGVMDAKAQGLQSLGLGMQGLAGPRNDGVAVGCVIDSLTIVMFVILTLMNVLVHLFAVGSARPQRSGPRFFALLQLFNFALLGFLLSNSLVQMLAFWEMTGVAAYFLVRLSCAREPPRGVFSGTGMRMFLMHTAGDAALLAGMGILLLKTGGAGGGLIGLAFSDDKGASILADTIRGAMNLQGSEYLFLPGAGGFLGMHWLTWVSLCFLVAALTRMAQFPFQTWVDEVAGTPAAVAALLLGTSMLAAGTFLLARVYPLWTMDARLIAAVVGCVTLATGALVALVQTDVRKILAWSTVSQGGYVLLFLGSGGYAAGLLHLFTHAFGKTALFLAAGSVLHGLVPGPGVPEAAHGDIRQMGGLWKRFPITAVAALIAVLAVGGVPYLSGAYATNLGLACVWDYAQALRGGGGSGGTGYVWWLVGVPVATTYVTALGLGRWWWLIFAGTNRNAKLYEHAHERPFLTLPVIILGALTVGLTFEFSGVILPLIMKSIPDMQLPLVVQGSEAGKAFIIPLTGWAFVGLLAAAGIYWGGFALPNWFRRLPGVAWVDYWLRERMFLDDLYDALMVVVWVLVRAVQGGERVVRGIVKALAGVVGLMVAAVSRIEGVGRVGAPEETAPPTPKAEPETSS